MRRANDFYPTPSWAANGIGSTVYQAIKMGRRGYGTELSSEYWKHSVGYCEQAEQEMSVPTLFDLMDFIAA